MKKRLKKLKTNKSLKEVSSDLSKIKIKLGVSGVRQSINRSFEKIIKAYAELNDENLTQEQIKILAKDTEIQKIFIDHLNNYDK